MSLINDVLRDLDERRRREGTPEEDVLSGLRPAAEKAPRGRPPVAVRKVAWLLVGGLAAWGLWVAFPFGSDLPSSQSAGASGSPAGPSSLPPVTANAPTGPETAARPSEGAILAAVPPSGAPAREPPGMAPPDDGPPVEGAAARALPEPPATPGARGVGEAGRTDGARGSVEKLRRPPTRGELAQREYREALRLNQRGEEDAARERLWQALDHAPGHRAARLALATLLARAGQLGEARELLDAGLAGDPDYAAFARLQARVLVELGAVDEAAALLERAARPLVVDPETHAFLAALYQRQGRHDRAARLYGEVLRFDSRRAAWWMGLGISLEAEGRLEEALSAFRAAQQAALRHGDVLDPASRRYVADRIGQLAQPSRSPESRSSR